MKLLYLGVQWDNGTFRDTNFLYQNEYTHIIFSILNYLYEYISLEEKTVFPETIQLTLKGRQYFWHSSAWSHTYNSEHVAASVYIRFHSPRCEGKSIHVFLSFSFCLAFTCAKTKFCVRYYDKQMWWPKNLCISKTGIEQEKGIRSKMRTDGERLTWIKFLISPIAVINLTKI